MPDKYVHVHLLISYITHLISWSRSQIPRASEPFIYHVCSGHLSTVYIIPTSLRLLLGLRLQEQNARHPPRQARQRATRPWPSTRCLTSSIRSTVEALKPRRLPGPKSSLSRASRRTTTMLEESSNARSAVRKFLSAILPREALRSICGRPINSSGQLALILFALPSRTY